ncbi:MAG TPA: cyclase family protein [Methylomirabilota bacterium]|nr:cyclase family protein [Methylomirabilota bacterium]
MEYSDLTLSLDHDWMPDEILPIAAHFYLAPKYHPDKGIILGSETGTCLTLPSTYADFRKTKRLHEVPPEKLFLRATTILDVPKQESEAINESELKRAIDKAGLPKGNALLLRTGWGDRGFQKEGGSRYVLASPYLSPEAATLLASFMAEQESDLLLMDSALIGRPDKHLIPEWISLFPRPGPWPSPEAQMYLNLYTLEKAKEDFAVELILAQAGIMTVKRLVDCAGLVTGSLRIIVSPLHIVRGVSSTCRVIAVKE